MDLDPVRLRTLHKISVLGSMTDTAAALGYTTGAVSQQMSALERATGRVLLVKVGRRVQLTDAGVVLARHARRILDEHDSALVALDDVEESLNVRVTIGVFATAAASLLAPVLGRLTVSHPQLEVRTIEVDVDDASAAVSRGDVDLAFGLDYGDAPIPRSADVQLIMLRTETFMIGHHKDRSFGTGPSVALAALAEEQWILPPGDTHYGLAMRLACRRAGYEPLVRHEVTDTATTLTMVSEGLGVAPITELMLRWRGEGLATTPLKQQVERRLVLARRKGPGLRASVRVVADAFTGYVQVAPAPTLP